MVQAILDGRKTQTRRVVKPQPTTFGDGWYADWYDHGNEIAFWNRESKKMSEPKTWKCPYGIPGDRLYVKESWQTGNKLDRCNAEQIREMANDAGYENGVFCPIWYRDGVYRQWGENDVCDFGESGRWRGPRFMPRWASRINLRVTGIRVERVQDISEADCMAEGLTPMCNHDTETDVRMGFESLWDSINGKKPGRSWAGNPWVWVVEFERED